MAMYTWTVRFIPDTQRYPQLQERWTWVDQPTSLHIPSILEQVRLEFHDLYDSVVALPDSFELSIREEETGQFKVFTTDGQLQQSVDGLDRRDQILGLHFQARAMYTGQGVANAAKGAVSVNARRIRRPEELTARLSVIPVPVVTNMPGMDKAVEIFNIPADLLIRYGKEAHEGHIMEAKKLPGISCVQFNESNTKCSIEGSNVDSCRYARTTIELFQELYRLPHQLLAMFTVKNYKKINDIRKMSNAIIVEYEINEFCMTFSLIGLSYEVRRALKEFKSEVAKLTCPQRLASASATNLPFTCGGESASGGAGGNGDAGGKKRKTGSNAGNECIVCMADEAVMALLPCGHKQTCSECAGKLFKGKKKECPTCRTPIKDIVRIFAD